MIGSLDYAQARIQSRHGRRIDERAWLQLHGARSFAAALETARTSPAATWVSGIDLHAGCDAIELQLRQRLRERIAEVAGWMPESWQSAVRWTATLIDLPALLHLATGAAPRAWMTREPALAPFAVLDGEARRRAFAGSAFAFLVPTDDAPAAARRAQAARTGWLAAWRRRWPASDRAEADTLAGLVRLFEDHVARFAATDREQAWAARRALQTRLEALFRRWALTPAAAMAHVALLALEVERLRAELVVRAAFRAGAAP